MSSLTPRRSENDSLGSISIPSFNTNLSVINYIFGTFPYLHPRKDLIPKLFFTRQNTTKHQQTHPSRHSKWTGSSIHVPRLRRQAQNNKWRICRSLSWWLPFLWYMYLALSVLDGPPALKKVVYWGWPVIGLKRNISIRKRGWWKKIIGKEAEQKKTKIESETKSITNSEKEMLIDDKDNKSKNDENTNESNTRNNDSTKAPTKTSMHRQLPPQSIASPLASHDPLSNNYVDIPLQGSGVRELFTPTMYGQHAQPTVDEATKEEWETMKSFWGARLERQLSGRLWRTAISFSSWLLLYCDLLWNISFPILFERLDLYCWCHYLD